jgi:energy-coupling factor transport system substrate-specific component
LNEKQRKNPLSVREICLFSVFGAMMFGFKFLMEALPNIHPLALFLCAFTLVYRSKALIPLFVYVLLDGVRLGFSVTWVPYIYIWLPLWAVIMLVNRHGWVFPVTDTSKGLRVLKIILPALFCGIEGMAFGTLYTPVQALAFHYDFKQSVAWVIAGLGFDAVHAAGNFSMGLLSIPLATLIIKLEKQHKQQETRSF